jgi:hypothetical protein
MKKSLVVSVVAVITLFVSVALAQRRPVPGQKPVEQVKPIEKASPLAKPTTATLVPLCPKLAFVTSSPLPSTGVLWDYKCQVEVSGGCALNRFCVSTLDTKGMKKLTSNLDAPGLTISPSGLIKGQPTDAGYYTITIRVEHNCPGGFQIIEKKFAIEVKGPAK